VAVSSSALNFELTAASPKVWRSRLIAIVLMLGIGGIFWVDSRYPALVKKYRAGTQVKVTGAITFGVLYQVDRSMPLAKRVWRTSLNWLDANRIGMTFAFVFGPAALTLLATLRRRRMKSRYLNALLGMFAGMPLGVCANCVAPIGRGLYESGMSTESVLAAMFSSPALNVVVLAMTLALFPLPIVALKFATVLLLIFVFAPYIASRGAQSAPGVDASCAVSIESTETWAQTLLSTLKCYAKSFWVVFRVGFPLMLLAAVLGALVIELVPLAAINAPVSIVGLVLVALIGAFLPVPMAFDVVIAYVAMTRGVPLPYVAVLLCTLGIYSVYSLTVLGKTISWKTATAAYAAVAFLGVCAGAFVRVFL
jgi:uncharacterized membrane protein YraQ (UPF0718 family)